MTKKIFVYGSLMKGFFNYNKYIKGKVKISIAAKTKGKLYHLLERGYPAMVEGNQDIYGELIEIENFQNNLKVLDKLENYTEKNFRVNEYNRIIKDIEVLETGEKVEAYVYQFNLENINNRKVDTIYIPSGNWREYMESKTEKII
ncbi:gamma-glutamylcyclotransferase [Clostridium sp. D2Q-14]|uniref:gamma-glutamylcyclotransferase family protein n=1 Tax=Anaeromonas gelatinilytica TaxID=2683194 RepID=UPI00193B7E36|nr:gamma-glutamylcyclotransferase family protein [Anaeromonas gelatinilytica]MBS4536415.1 gamma-glutamylcyclotransferase [Anaeromonas gelatinilytica]